MDFRQQCVDLLRSESEWPIPNLPFESLTYQFSKSEISFDRNEAIKINGIYRLRSIPPLDKTVYIVDLGSHNLHLFAIRRIAMAFTTSSRKYYTRKKEAVENLIFIVIHSNGLLSIVHCQGENALSATMAVSGKEPGNHCPLFLAATQFSQIVKEHWSLPPHLYVRYKRTRDPIKCIEETVDEHAPELMRLFIRAKRAPALTQSEEDILFYQLRDGSEKAKEKLITCHLIVAFEQAYRFFRRYEESNVSFEDAFYGALDGLLISLDRYAPEEGCRFRSFAWFWIYRGVDRNFTANRFPINFPYYVWEKVMKLCRYLPIIEYKLSSTQSSNSLEDAVVNWTKKTIPAKQFFDKDSEQERRSIYVQATKLLTWQQPTIEPVEFFDELSVSPWDDIINQKYFRELLTTAGNSLKPRYWQIIQYRNGLHPESFDIPLTLEETGKKLGITRERVRQMELRAKVEFRNALKKTIDDFELALLELDKPSSEPPSNFQFQKIRVSPPLIATNLNKGVKEISLEDIISEPLTHSTDMSQIFKSEDFQQFEKEFLATVENFKSAIDYRSLYLFLSRLRQTTSNNRIILIPVSHLLKSADVKGRGYLKVKEIDTILTALNVKSVPHFNSVGVDDSIELIFGKIYPLT